MSTLLVALLSMVGFVVAYRTYGYWLGSRLFGLKDTSVMPSHALKDDVDYVPTAKSVIFGHHFTSIAGTGPIVGPAIAVFWGWLPALLWVVFGAILIGGVHDLSTLVISLRNRGQTIGETAGRLISPRAKILFLLVLALALSVVLAIFGLVIATIFKIYPESVLSVWTAMPVAVAIGFFVRRGGSLLIASIVGLVILYLAVWVGAYWMPIRIDGWFSEENTLWTPVVVWTLALLLYAFAASVLPVWMLLQPRDYINSHQLYVALGLLIVGLLVASLTGSADLTASTPAVTPDPPGDAPPIFPFLFVTIACGACSGFHCLVSSGTTSKQVDKETDALSIGYGAMLLEGALAVLVILACCAGVGMGRVEHMAEGGYQVDTSVTGQAAWESYYGGSWSGHGLSKKLGAFVDGGANFLGALGLPLQLGITIMAVLVASFAATTLDTATRLQRYVIQELAVTAKIKTLENRFVATGLAIAIGLGIALFAGEKPGAGGKELWPLFGATNQLLAGLALMVATFYLLRRKKNIWIVAVPMIFMLLIPVCAMIYNLTKTNGWIAEENYTLMAFAVVILGLQIWMCIEGLILFPRVRGVLEESLPPIETAGREPG